MATTYTLCDFRSYNKTELSAKNLKEARREALQVLRETYAYECSEDKNFISGKRGEFYIRRKKEDGTVFDYNL